MKCNSLVYKNMFRFVTLVDGVSTFQGKRIRVLTPKGTNVKIQHFGWLTETLKSHISFIQYSFLTKFVLLDFKSSLVLW